MKVALIACSKNKQNQLCKAEEMYDKSTLFKKAKNYVQNQNYDQWFILSAKYGLLRPEEIITPYDKTLNNMNSKEIKQWSEDVFNKLNNYNLHEIDLYAGDKYRKYLIPLLESQNIKCNIPLKGMGIGKQLQFYTQRG